MTHGQELLMAVMAGYWAQPIIRNLRSRLLHWRLSRDYRASEARMRACTHRRVARVNTGSDTYAVWQDKCADCLALYMSGIYQHGERPYWTPNGAPLAPGTMVEERAPRPVEWPAARGGASRKGER